MAVASDSMAIVFDLMAGVFHGCGSCMTALFDWVVGDDRMVTWFASLILPVIVGDLPWMLTTALSNACARGNVIALGRLNPNH